MFEEKIQIHFEATSLAEILKEAGADFEITDSNQELERVVTVPCLLRRSSGKVEIQVEDGKAATMREITNKLKMNSSHLSPYIIKLI